MRTTLAIDDDVLEEARELASVEGRSLGAVISELARRGLAPTPIRMDADFPVFDVEVDAPAITGKDVARALDDQ
ncbi:type II toxin-antitoxin system VapB family antitoxin [Nocardioides sp. AE5]|uniref:type II toxin-antitoxin system VapB family antitoxin n=1 Tax=Nocardioides sp. AE5 TaxID=2962573 RepID=UPI0028816B7A|nr:type II toxin-antitoxin system VapB family antitoxin [Nocardioides sp. AE5]MDT0200361.1 type II toxin-antitoxin system VapB family antitoxin [Nocardioides sp. AE5]